MKCSTSESWATRSCRDSPLHAGSVVGILPCTGRRRAGQMSVHSPVCRASGTIGSMTGPKKQAVGWSRAHRNIAITLRENAASAQELHPSRSMQLFGKYRSCMPVRAPFARELRPKLAGRRAQGRRSRGHISRFQTAQIVPAARFLRPGFATLASRNPMKGWRSAESRTGPRRPVGLHMTRQARRLARRLASLGRRPPLGARTVAILGGGTALLSPVRRASFSRPGRSARAGGSLPPEAAVASRRRGTPRLAPSSGSSLEHAPLNERGWNVLLRSPNRSQQENAKCICLQIASDGPIESVANSIG